MKKLILALSICAAALGLFSTQAVADTWDQLTKFTFSQPVEIPGQVLAAGTYWFKLVDLPADRDVVQIFNSDQNKVIATIMAIPDYRLKPTGKTVVTFEERAVSSPEAIKAWFYPGDNYGQEFVYPRPRAIQLAKLVKQPVLSMPANLEPITKPAANSAKESTAAALKAAPLKAEQPSGEESEVGTVVTTPPQLLAQNKAPAAAPATPAPASLPATASDLPSIGLFGLVLMAVGLALRFRTSRT